ncbi:MAG: motility protein A [Cellulomonas sp.]|uniref:Motility protein A n=1 Tax=Cellulomonas gelida TaxID=1712 RepID=A0A4Y3KSL5_9CELL|nr:MULTISPECIES: motility protein A [Cellulomonas]KMM44245.1 flagellar motor protein MotA [Cellulomonas sp. A375-1]MCR6649614.1 motility protein A [Cellulomonas sp.]MCR6705586.1 motility protein A [Cellulomonas sp.]GEA85848.1 motility protein A [Cellulomonas gelida]GGL16790.1 motility protein A [Cellulomonas gelida]
MDPAGLIGIGVALSAIFGAMILEGAQPMSIMLPAPLLLVWLGTLGVGVAGHTLRDVKNAFAAVPRALRSKAPDPSVTVDTVVSLADRARREGLLALEDAARDIDDEFLRTGLQAAIDGTDPEDLRIILEDRIATKRTQEKVNSKYFQDMGGYAPTIGIIGTVISLVHVLENLSEPATLGHSIAAAFVATLWGILSANVVWLPLSARIKRISDLECAHMEVTLEGLLAVQAGANPRVVGERLRSLIPHDMVAEPRQAAA